MSNNHDDNDNDNEKTGADKRVLQPAGWAAPRGYANGVAATGTLVSVAGQIGWNGSNQSRSATCGAYRKFQIRIGPTPGNFHSQNRHAACARS